MDQVDREILAELWHFEFHKNVKKMLIQFGRISRSNISDIYLSIHPINMVPRSFRISFLSYFYWLCLILEVN